ncbi:hypothetical protein SAMN04487969_102489 [Paenibacillus algorifonticola]|uniref:Uncharacterized protein n=1 Tax=Paenibacillus algorifonticola TaxID=684063 RepID=A0A1I2AGS3_9BACL|nr:hypothetical protein [Paenibacillus algorifonticola]SFE43214.1 hypothetical protein SAMN04487969_102489 [Paenibacillus algorifonticola]
MANYTESAVTTLGQALIAKGQAGAAINFTRMQIGSGQLGGGNPASRTALITPIAYFNINSIAVNANTASVLGIFENAGLPTSTYTCEIGVFAQDPDLGEILYAYANAETQGDTFPPISSGPYSLQFRMNVAVGNTTTVTATIPPGAYIPESEASVDPDPNTIVRRTSGGQVKAAAPVVANDAARKAEIESPPFVTTTGTGAAYVATFSPAYTALVPGTRITVKIHMANTGAATVNVNGLGAKPMLKSNGNPLSAGNLKLNSVYSLVYDGTSFILQGEGGEYGNAIAPQVLAPNTFGTEAGVMAGTMPNRGAVTITPGQTVQTIAEGYHNGSGSVSAVLFDAAKVAADTTIAGKQGAMPLRGGEEYPGWVRAEMGPVLGAAGRIHLRSPLGAYLDGGGDGAGYMGIFADDPDYIASNIRQGVDVFGLVGTMPEGYRVVSGNALSSSSGIFFPTKNGDQFLQYIEITGFNMASIAMVFSQANDATGIVSLYSPLTTQDGQAGYDYYTENPTASAGNKYWTQASVGKSLTANYICMPTFGASIAHKYIVVGK